MSSLAAPCTRSAPLPPPFLASLSRLPPRLLDGLLDRTHTPRVQVFLVTEERWLTRMSTYVSETYKGPLKIEVIVVDEVTLAPAAALALALAPAAALALTLAPAAALALTLALAWSLSLCLSLTRSRGHTRPPSPGGGQRGGSAQDHPEAAQVRLRLKA